MSPEEKEMELIEECEEIKREMRFIASLLCDPTLDQVQIDDLEEEYDDLEAEYDDLRQQLRGDF